MIQITNLLDSFVFLALTWVMSLQVVMSTDGKVVGFQPTSRVAVNLWASNPLATLLYGGRKLSPGKLIKPQSPWLFLIPCYQFFLNFRGAGLLEPTLKIPRPSEVVLIEM